MDLPFALEGFFFEKVNGSTGQRVTFTFHYIIYVPASRHTLQRCLFLCCWQAAESNSAPFAALHLNAVCRCTSQLPLRVSFSKRLTGRRVNGSNGSHLNGVCRWTSQLPWGVLFRKGQQVDGSTGQRVNRSTGQRVKRVDGPTGHFHFHYIIYDSRRCRLTPPRCKKHTAYDDTRLTPHHCKKHTASFACSTGKFPSV